MFSHLKTAIQYDLLAVMRHLRCWCQSAQAECCLVSFSILPASSEVTLNFFLVLAQRSSMPYNEIGFSVALIGEISSVLLPLSCLVLQVSLSFSSLSLFTGNLLRYNMAPAKCLS